MTHQRPGIHVPNHGNFVPLQILVGSFSRAPIRRHVRKIAHHEPFDVWTRRFLILQIRANISNVGIRQADNLAGITGIGENFLVTGETRIKNNFPATAATSARRAALKYSSVFEREDGARFVPLPQCILRCGSSYTSFVVQILLRISRRAEHTLSWRCNLAKFPERPVRKHRFAVNIFSRHRPKNPRIV